MNLWDTHCHLFFEYYDDISKIIDEAIQNGITHFIVSGCDAKSNKEIVELVHKYPFIYGVLGLHPSECEKYQKRDLEFIESHINDSKILGIGEIGLDYHYSKEFKDNQKILFQKQMELAEKYQKPVVIHSRDATEETIQILKNYSVKGVIHSYSGSLETAKIYINMGYYLGINGVITFKNSKLKQILPAIFPQIILETDCPYLTPHPYRGMKNSPKYILLIAKFIAEELDIPLSQVEKVTNQNVYTIFDIKDKL